MFVCVCLCASVQGRGRKRTNTTAVRFTPENHMQVCKNLMGQAGGSAITALALVTISIACVARGDEIRSILLMWFGVMQMEVIGKLLGQFGTCYSTCYSTCWLQLVLCTVYE